MALSTFRVNTHGAANQGDPTIAVLADGGFVIAWRSDDQDGSGAGIFAQRYGPGGAPLGAEFRVNLQTSAEQFDPTIAALAGGGFVITWSSDDQDGSSDGIYGQRFDAGGNPAGSEFRANTFTTGRQTTGVVSALTDGGFVVIWESVEQDGSSWGVFGQRYDSSGAPAGPEFRANTFTTDTQGWPNVSGLTDGGFLVTWMSFQSPGAASDIYGQRYNAAGAPVGAEFRVNNFTDNYQQNPSAAALADGSFVVIWSSRGQSSQFQESVYGQRYDAAGTPLGVEFRIDTSDSDARRPSIAALADGGFVVTWLTGFSSSIMARRFDASGNPVTPEYRIDDQPSFRTSMTVAGLPDGSFIAAWEAFSSGSGNDIFARVPPLPVVLTPGMDTIAGDAGDSLVLTRPGDLGALDSVAGGAGNDALQLTEAGILDLTAPSLFSGFEYVLGSAGWDTFILSSDRMPAVLIDGAGGTDTVQASGNLSFSGVSLAAVERLAFAGTAAATVTFFKSGSSLLPSLTVTGDAHANSLAFALTSAGNLDLGSWFFVDWTSGQDAVTISGSAGADRIFGSRVRDIVSGGDGDDILSGRDGDDVLGGGEGADSLHGDEGADALSGDGGDDVLRGDAGADAISGGPGRDFAEGGTGDDLVEGDGGDDVLHGSDGADTLRGLVGNDLLDGGPGADTIDGGADFDLASYRTSSIGAYIDLADQSLNDWGAAGDASSGVELFWLSDQNDQFYAAASGAIAWGFAGDDILAGRDGSDILSGGAGGDTLMGGPGTDYVHFDAAGNGVIVDFTDPARQTFEAAGDYYGEMEGFYLTNLHDSFTGQTVLNIVYGLDGNDQLFGGVNANDVLDGGAGDDFLSGGNLDDTLAGGPGGDLFAFVDAASNGFDSLLGFLTGEDVLQLTGTGFGNLAAGSTFADGSTFIAAAAPAPVTAAATLLYYTGSGILYFDADGNGAGSASVIAQIAGAPVVQASDFVVV